MYHVYLKYIGDTSSILGVPHVFADTLIVFGVPQVYQGYIKCIGGQLIGLGGHPVSPAALLPMAPRDTLVAPVVTLLCSSGYHSLGSEVNPLAPGSPHKLLRSSRQLLRLAHVLLGSLSLHKGVVNDFLRQLFVKNDFSTRQF